MILILSNSWPFLKIYLSGLILVAFLFPSGLPRLTLDLEYSKAFLTAYLHVFTGRSGGVGSYFHCFQ